MDILYSAREMALMPRAKAHAYSRWLGERVTEIEREVGPLVEGEEGHALTSVALDRLTSGRTRRESGLPHSPLTPLEAWLQAEVAAAGVAAAHEMVTGEQVTQVAQLALRQSLAEFGGRQFHEAGYTIAA